MAADGPATFSLCTNYPPSTHLLHRLEPLVVSLELIGEAGGLRGELARHVPDAGGELA